MKTFKTLLITVLVLLCSTAVNAHDFEVDGIYYNITDATNNMVEVTYKGSSYSQYSNEYSGNVVIPVNVIADAYVSFTSWTSSNNSNGSTSQAEYTLNVKAGDILSFDWSVSSESNYDWLIVTLDGTEIVKKSGTLTGSYEKKFDVAGTHALVFKYTKDGSTSSGDDKANVYNVKLGQEKVYSVTSIGDYAFYLCSGLTSITIGNSVTSIGDYAFYHCSGLTSITIGNSVTSIGQYAFSHCSSITSLTIPNSVIRIKSCAFDYCSGLKKLHIEDGTTNLAIGHNDCSEDEDYAMFYGSALETVYLGRNIDIIYGYYSSWVSPFYKLTTLTSVTIGKNVTKMTDGLFGYCSNLSSIVVKDDNSYLDSRDNCNAIIETATNTLVAGCKSTIIPNSVTSVGDYAFCACSGLTSIIIPDGVVRIGKCAFSNCSNLRSIAVPNSVTSIGYYAFSNTAWYNNQPDGVIYVGKVLYNYKGSMSENTSITIKDGTLRISDYAFSGCAGLTNITIPNSVTSIGSDAFEGCTGLSSVTIPNSVTSIGSDAFEGCTGLSSVTIPNSVTNIGNYAFFRCSGLTSVTSLIPAEELFAINTNVFSSVDKTKCTLYVPYGAKSTYEVTAGWSEFTNIVELEKPIADVTISINQYGSGTYCSEYALDFSEVNGLKAYAVTGYNVNTGVVTLTRVQTAREGTGLFIKGEPGEYIVPIMEKSDDYSLNMLVGTLATTTVNAVSDDGLYRNYKYTIMDGDATPMFYQFEDNSSLSANRAYLQIPLSWISSASKSVAVRFDDAETTDLDEVISENNDGSVKSNIVYDLNGRAVENPSTGIYIINGKKVYIK